MKRIFLLTLFVVWGSVSYAQVAGGAATNQGNGKRTEELNSRGIAAQDMPPPGSTYVDASVLANVKADEYVAVFGIVQEGATPVECNQKVDAAVISLTDSLKKLGISQKDIFVDFIIQNRIYDYDIQDSTAKERLAGFELKNISIHYRDRDMLDKLVAAAAMSQVYDLIKVDYVVNNLRGVQSMLMQRAAAIIKQKAAMMNASLGLKLGGRTQVIAQRFNSYFPTEMYGSYQAAEGEEIQLPYNSNFTIQKARRARTFYFEPLDAKLFDDVMNPIVLEPVVQFSIYVKVKYASVMPSQPPKTASA